jgi:hypothetical protein
MMDATKVRWIYYACICLVLAFGICQHAVLVKTTYDLRQIRVVEAEFSLPIHNHTYVMGSYPQQHRRPKKRVVYSRLRTDQSGWVIFDMLKAHTFAFHEKDVTSYGGACGESTHKEDVQRVLTAVGWDGILPLKCPDENETTAEILGGSYYQKKHGRRMGSPIWRKYIMDHIDYPPESGNFTMVVHMRRRDVTPCCYPNWYLPNSYFQAMIEKFSQGRANVHVQIFSQSDSFESWDAFQNNHNSTANGYELNLDGPVGDVWRAIITADVFIGSRSEFSRVPALFAKGHLVDPWKIEDAKIANETSVEGNRLLDSCSIFQLSSCKNKWWLEKQKT